LFYWVYLTLKDLFVQIDLKISFSHLFFLYSNKKSIDSLNWQQFIGLGVQVPLSSSQFQSASSSSISTWLTSARTFYIRFEFPLFFYFYFLNAVVHSHSFDRMCNLTGIQTPWPIMGGKRVDNEKRYFFLSHFLYICSVHQHSAHLSCSSLPVVSLLRLVEMINDIRLPPKEKRSRERKYSSPKCFSKTTTRIERLYKYKQTIGRLSFMLG
jgi:hypothetical protein